MTSFPDNSLAGQPSPPGQGADAAGGYPPSQPAAVPDAAGPRRAARDASRAVGREGTTAGPGAPLPGPAPASPPAALGRGRGAREEGPGSGIPRAAAGSPPAGEPGGDARVRTASSPGTRPLSGQEFRDQWKAARSSNAAAGRRRGGKPRPVVPPGSGRLRAAGPRPASFDELPAPPLRIKLPDPPPEAA